MNDSSQDISDYIGSKAQITVETQIGPQMAEALILGVSRIGLMFERTGLLRFYPWGRIIEITVLEVE